MSSCDPELGSHDFLCPTPLGDYDALLVLMLLPRLIFKAELVIDQLKQQVRNLHSCYVHVTMRVAVLGRNSLEPEEKSLVTVEHFLGNAESAVLILS